MKNLFSILVSIIIISATVNLLSQSSNNQIPEPRGISECLKQIDGKDKEGRPLYYSDKIYIKLQKNIKTFLKTSDVLQGTVHYKFGISSLDEKLEKYGIKTQKTYKQRTELLKKNKDYIQSSMRELPDLSRIYTLEFSESNNIRKVLKEFADDPNVEYAEPVPIMYLLEVPNDSLYSRQQHLPQIKADSAWDVFKGENGTQEIVIGICDQGVEWFHHDLLKNLKQNLGEDADHDGHVIEYRESDSTWVFDPGDTNHIDDDGNGYVDDFIGWDFFTDTKSKAESNNPSDSQGHGTHVAGISAGVSNNDTGIASISYNVKYLPTSHSALNFGYIEKGYEGIVYLAENGADIINCSWGGGGYSTTEAESIAYASGLGAILVIAAGNDYIERTFYPASYPNVISVASVTVEDRKTNYSNYGIGVDITAPGGDYGIDGGILSTLPNHSYGSYQGTSMASPVAAGCMGLLKAYHPEWTNAQLEAQFFGSADNIDSLNANYINKLGAGRVNPYRSLIETNPSAPNKLRLELYRVVTNDSLSDNDGALEPGDTVNIGFVIRNYAHLLSSNSVNFTLESLDPDIEVIKGSYTGRINPDGYSNIPPDFEVKISQSAEARYAKLRIKTASDSEDIIFGKSMDFEIAITKGGILVWEGSPARGYSGTFIRDFLNEQGINVTYSNEFPTTLFGYVAVFLCFGSQGSSGMFTTGFGDWKADIVKEYALSGGKIYLEGTEAFGWDQKDNKELLNLFGIQDMDDGNGSIVLDTIIGQTSAITMNMLFDGSKASRFDFVDFVKSGDGTTAFIQPDYGIIAMQNIGWFNQKTFYNSYPIAELYDHSQPSTRYELVSRIMNFLGIPIDYTVPDFSVQPMTGHAPLEINFTDKSLTTKPIESWSWDFGDNQGGSSLQKNPKWIYNVPGTYDARMNISRADKNFDTTYRVYIFDGESALDYNNRTGYAEIQPSPPINLFNRLTIEAWIKPRSPGRSGSGRIVDKTNFTFNIGWDRSLRFNFTNDSNLVSNVYTDKNKINSNIWQHVAVTYDGDSVVKFYINGNPIVDTIFKTQNIPQGLIMDNSAFPLLFGNNSNKTSPFDGSIDEIRMWNVVRTQQELIQNMNTILNGNENGLAGYWRFQEGNGATTKDETSNQNDASVFSDWRQGWHSSYIKTQPVRQFLCEGQDAAFSINAVGGEKTLTYHWYKDNQPLTGDNRIIGVDSTTLVVNNIIKSDEGNYYSIVTANPGNIKISSDTVEIKAKEKIAIQRGLPFREVRVLNGGVMNLSVEATGEAPIVYMWFKNDVQIPGAVASILIKSPFTKQDEGIYYCVVSNQCNTVISDTFNVLLNTTSVEDNTSDILINVYPNPFNGLTTFYLNLENPQSVRLVINDILGNEVSVIANQRLEAGLHRFNFNASALSLSSGIYIYSLNIEGKKFTGLLNLIK